MTTQAPEAVTTAELGRARYAPLLDTVEAAVLADGADTPWHTTEDDPGLTVLQVHAPGAAVEIRLALPLGDTAGYWHPGADWRRTPVADWEGRARVGLVKGLAAGCLYDSTGATLLAFAAADPVPEAALRYGVSEETDRYVVHLHLAPSERPHRVLFAPRAPGVAAALRPLRAWYRARTAAMPVPEAARLPLWCTWYAYNQQVTAAEVERQTRLAAELGFGAAILDDGWQRHAHGRGYAGVGDWLPDRDKFPDLTAHVAAVRGTGLRYLAWIAPLLLGPQADCHAAWAPYATRPAGVPGAHVLDPRRPEVRAHVVDTCVRLVREHGFDGLKLDFLDEAMVYAEDGGAELGPALVRLLTELRTALEAVRPELLLELRQPYVGPAMAEFGNLLRSFDCPADTTANRVRTLDTALLAAGGAVHSDPLLWAADAPVETAARNLISTLHAVPQVSVRLDALPAEHLDALRFWLAQWRALRPQLLDGVVEPGRPDELYPLVESVADGVRVVDVHGELAVPYTPGEFTETVLVNGSAADRVVMDVRGGPAPTEMAVHAPDGRMIDRIRTVLTPGLHSVPVPRTGLARIRGGEQAARRIVR
ncbi:glycoside hydrolase family 36 protein [Streptomyces sp. TLI_171]|uniref:glycoside hydrolase family 36 protein n=1 Tax=Streptomyces sp. TLI_171 TaxID=1938859 RepID=UPI000C1A4A9D|nr:glycoside hydrolase family 36 protein [Streptomyces sp. TLI_171]RKE17398.1 alpha-galactosidase [Streptomyces sp. TLI_171]